MVAEKALGKTFIIKAGGRAQCPGPNSKGAPASYPEKPRAALPSMVTQAYPGVGVLELLTARHIMAHAPGPALHSPKIELQSSWNPPLPLKHVSAPFFCLSPECSASPLGPRPRTEQGTWWEVLHFRISKSQQRRDGSQPREKAGGLLSPCLLALLHHARLDRPSPVLQVPILSHFWTTGEKPPPKGFPRGTGLAEGPRVWVINTLSNRERRQGPNHKRIQKWPWRTNVTPRDLVRCFWTLRRAFLLF